MQSAEAFHGSDVASPWFFPNSSKLLVSAQIGSGAHSFKATPKNGAQKKGKTDPVRFDPIQNVPL